MLKIGKVWKIWLGIFHSILQIDIFILDVIKASRGKLSYSTVHNKYCLDKMAKQNWFWLATDLLVIVLIQWYTYYGV